MTFTKAMIDLAKEIRRRAPADIKPTIKMANPDLFHELGKIYRQSDDAIMKALIKEICELAGDPWRDVLLSDEEQDEVTVRTYRGTTFLEPSRKSEESSGKSTAPKRIYRGQVITS